MRALSAWVALGWVVLGSIWPACVPAEPPKRCDIGARTRAVQAADRKLLGAGSHYPADTMLRGQDEQLARSHRLRREVAWRVVQKVLAPVELAYELPGLSPRVPAQVPRFQTWYGRDDVSRLFHHLYEDLGPDGRRARTRFTSLALDQAFVWNVDVLDTLANWPEDRWLAYIDAIDTASEVAGIGGIGRVAYSPAAARHFLASYPEILECLSQGPPGRFIDTAEPGPRQLLREPAQFEPCEQQVHGPFFVQAGETLIASLEGDADDL